MPAFFIIGCSEQKAPGPQAAAFKYAPRQHAAIRAAFMGPCGLWAAGHQLSILSAAFGLVDATTALPDYNVKMTQHGARMLASSAAAREAFLADIAGFDQVVVYGGGLYRSVVRAWLQGSEVELVELVGRDRGCGDHFSALLGYIADMQEDS